MLINDNRGKSKELSFDELETGKVYVSRRLQKYMMFTSEQATVCLETGEVFDSDEHLGDVFTEVKAVLEVS